MAERRGDASVDVLHGAFSIGREENDEGRDRGVVDGGEGVLLGACACIEAMAHVDDSGDDLGQHFREQEEAYLAHVLAYIERPGIVRDELRGADLEYQRGKARRLRRAALGAAEKLAADDGDEVVAG